MHSHPFLPPRDPLTYPARAGAGTDLRPECPAHVGPATPDPAAGRRVRRHDRRCAPAADKGFARAAGAREVDGKQPNGSRRENRRTPSSPPSAQAGGVVGAVPESYRQSPHHRRAAPSDTSLEYGGVREQNAQPARGTPASPRFAKPAAGTSPPWHPPYRADADSQILAGHGRLNGRPCQAGGSEVVL